MNSSGLELLLDLYECQASRLSDPAALEKILREGARVAGFDVVAQAAHQLSHQGVTLVPILSQSHLILHAWPEERFAAVDAYACGESQAMTRALDALRENLIAQFDSQSHTHRVIERGGIEHAFILSHLDASDEPE